MFWRTMSGRTLATLALLTLWLGGSAVAVTPSPLANLHLTLLDRVGVRLDSFGDSDGKIDELFEPVTL